MTDQVQIKRAVLQEVVDRLSALMNALDDEMMHTQADELDEVIQLLDPSHSATHEATADPPGSDDFQPPAEQP